MIERGKQNERNLVARETATSNSENASCGIWFDRDAKFVQLFCGREGGFVDLSQLCKRCALKPRCTKENFVFNANHNVTQEQTATQPTWTLFWTSVHTYSRSIRYNYTRSQIREHSSSSKFRSDCVRKHFAHPQPTGPNHLPEILSYKSLHSCKKRWENSTWDLRLLSLVPEIVVAKTKSSVIEMLVVKFGRNKSAQIWRNSTQAIKHRGLTLKSAYESRLTLGAPDRSESHNLSAITLYLIKMRSLTAASSTHPVM